MQNVDNDEYIYLGIQIGHYSDLSNYNIITEIKNLLN